MQTRNSIKTWADGNIYFNCTLKYSFFLFESHFLLLRPKSFGMFLCNTLKVICVKATENQQENESFNDLHQKWISVATYWLVD